MHNYELSPIDDINIVSVLHAFMAKSGAQSLTFKSVRDRQTKRQKYSSFLATPS